jgi:hypothetical protein
MIITILESKKCKKFPLSVVVYFHSVYAPQMFTAPLPVTPLGLILVSGIHIDLATRRDKVPPA